MVGFERFARGSRVYFEDVMGDKSSVGNLLNDITPESYFIQIQIDNGEILSMGWKEKPVVGGWRSIETAGDDRLLVKDFGLGRFWVVSVSYPTFHKEEAGRQKRKRRVRELLQSLSLDKLPKVYLDYKKTDGNLTDLTKGCIIVFGVSLGNVQPGRTFDITAMLERGNSSFADTAIFDRIDINFGDIGIFCNVLDNPRQKKFFDLQTVTKVIILARPKSRAAMVIKDLANQLFDLKKRFTRVMETIRSIDDEDYVDDTDDVDGTDAGDLGWY